MNISLSDVLSVIAIVIAFYTSTVVVRNRSQKDFFIGQLSDLKTEYRDFLNQMRNGLKSAEEIRDMLSYLTNRITSLNTVLNSEYSMSEDTLESAHNDFLWNITELESLQIQFENDTVKFSSEDMARVLALYAEVDKSFLRKAVQLNIASQILPWQRPEENLGF